MNRVYINTLKLTGFRNHKATSLDTDSGHVVLFGENGAGKTNILEALSFLSPGRGMRRAKLDEIANQSIGGAWSVFAKLVNRDDETRIGTGLNPQAGETQRKIHLDGEQAKTSEALLEHARILWLTPAMDGLFAGPASDRRKFLDRLVLAIDTVHGRRVSGFENQMRARNRLLSEPNPDARWLDAVEAQLAEAAIAIAAARQELVTLLSEVMINHHDEKSPFPDSLLSISGSLEQSVGEISASELEAEYANRLAMARPIDARAGRTLEGPHRSDFVVQHRPKMMPAKLCSTGEQKALLTGLVLAHARLVANMAGFNPILLLDEIAAHLDEGRRAALYNLLETLDCQTWMTGTDQSLFEALGERARFFQVEDGTAKAIE